MNNISSEDKYRIYQEEKVRLEAQQTARAQVRTKRLKGCAIAVLCLLIGIPVVIFGIVGVNRWRMENDVGAEGLLSGKYFNGVKVYDSPDSLYRHIEMGGKEDLQLFRDGKITIIQNKVRVRIIGTDGACYKIEILPTELAENLASKSGWIERVDVNIITNKK